MMMEHLLGKVHCMGALRLLDQIKNSPIHLVLTDPDWGVGLSYEFGKIADSPKEHWRKLRPVYQELLRVLKPGHPLAIIQGMRYVSKFPEWFGCFDTIMSIAINATRFSTYTTPIVLQTGERRLYPVSQHYVYGCYTQFDCDFLIRFGQDFPCPQPITILRQLVRMLSKPGDIVLDPFLGSGTTAIACELEGRRWIGCDWHGPYCELAEERLRETRTEMQMCTEGAT
jgi:DNA modification methylase